MRMLLLLVWSALAVGVYLIGSPGEAAAPTAVVYFSDAAPLGLAAIGPTALPWDDIIGLRLVPAATNA